MAIYFSKENIPWLRSFHLPRLGRRGAFAVPYGVWYEAVNLRRVLGMENLPLQGTGPYPSLGKGKTFSKSAFFWWDMFFFPRSITLKSRFYLGKLGKI